MPQVWFHRISVFDSEGNPKEGNMIEQDIGGPLCFQGDYIGRVLFFFLYICYHISDSYYLNCLFLSLEAKQRPLPKIEAGDLLVMHDTGGYTYSLYSRY